jgi:hypothetical protein
VSEHGGSTFWSTSLVVVSGASCAGLLGFILAFVAGGAGHGTLLPLATLFPWGLVAANWLPLPSQGTRDLVGVLTALVEWPLYAVILRAGVWLNRTRGAIGVIVLLHVVAAAVAVFKTSV